MNGCWLLAVVLLSVVRSPEVPRKAKGEGKEEEEER